MYIPPGVVWAIVEGNGTVWHHQCGGYACRQETIRGELVQLGTEDAENKLLNFFVDPKWGGWCDRGIDIETAEFIESIVPRFVVDRARLEQSCEAWIFGALDGKSAVLVWGNSD